MLPQLILTGGFKERVSDKPHVLRKRGEVLFDLGLLVCGVIHFHAPPEVILSFLAPPGRVAESDASVPVDPLACPGLRRLVPGLPQDDLLELPLLFDCQVAVNLCIFRYKSCRGRDDRGSRWGGQGETEENEEDDGDEFLHYELCK